MTATSQPTATQTVFHLKIGADYTIALPPDLREQFGLDSGDVIAISVLGGHGFLYKVPKEMAAHPVTTEPVPELKGLLADYFTDREDVRQFIEDERRGWDEREQKLDR